MKLIEASLPFYQYNLLPIYMYAVISTSGLNNIYMITITTTGVISILT